jgi:CheY-like chemotaxis protein
LLRSGIAAAKAQDRVRARQYLREAVQLDPRCESAWLWLAGLAEAPLESLRCLDRVLALNPGHERARAAARAARLQAGIAAARSQQREAARDLLSHVVEDDPGNESAWLWLSSVAASPQEAASCLETVLRINPDNEQARGSLERYHAQLAAGSQQNGTNGAAPHADGAAEEANPWFCPFCGAEDEDVPECCPGCGALLLPDDVLLFRTHRGADAEKVAAFLAEMESGDYTHHFAACYQVGLAYLNLRRFDAALNALSEALRLRPDDREIRALVTEVARLVQADNTAPPDDRRHTVLIADGSPAVCKLVSMLLEENGYQARSAADGYEVVDLLREQGPPDLFLLDADLPGLDGYQLCRLLRGNPDTADRPIVLLGQDSILTKVRRGLAGASGHLNKPFRPAALLHVVARHCRPSDPAPTANGAAH